jgi:hypothetical protein
MTSQRAKALLAAGEGQTVDYKVEVGGLTPDDLCAFANTKQGGAVLLGVAEAREPDGREFGEPVGCSVDDSSKLALLNKALSCHPPISVTIHPESAGKISFLRVEIKPSETGPHCTPRGTYLSRVGSRNAALLPPALLAMFLEREAGAFQTRFSQAAQEITASISETAEAVAVLQKDIGKRIEDISDQLGWSDSMFDDTGDKVDRVEALLHELTRRAVDTGSRLRAIAAGTKSEDPVKERAVTEAKEALRTTLLENLDMIKNARTGDKLEMRTSGAIAEELSQDDIQALFSEIVEELLLAHPNKPIEEV